MDSHQKLSNLIGTYVASSIFGSARGFYLEGMRPITESTIIYGACAYYNRCYKSLITGDDAYVRNLFLQFRSCSDHAPVCLFNFIIAITEAVAKQMKLEGINYENLDSFTNSFTTQLIPLTNIATAAMMMGLKHDCRGEKDPSKLNANEPLVSFSNRPPVGGESCEVCNRPGSFHCSGCGKRHYCSRAHQKEDWTRNNHKAYCTPTYIRKNEYFTAKFPQKQLTAKKDLPKGTVLFQCQSDVIRATEYRDAIEAAAEISGKLIKLKEWVHWYEESLKVVGKAVYSNQRPNEAQNSFNLVLPVIFFPRSETLNVAVNDNFEFVVLTDIKLGEELSI